MKKKLLSVVALIMAVTLLFSACGTTDVTSSETSVSQTADASGEQLSGYTLNGVPLEEYKIIYAEDPYGYGREFARTLRSGVQDNTGVTLKISEDTGEPSEYEIVFGDTKREVNLKKDTLGKLDYAVCAEGKKVVVNAGEYYTLELAAEEFVNICLEGKEITVPETPTVKTFEFEKPKSVILLIGDGMGENHIKYTLENGLDVFIGDIMVNKGYCTTSSVTGTTDSAAAATALSTGYKTTNGKVGKDMNGKDLKVMGELAIEKDKALMVLSNYAIYDATPAAFTAHGDDRCTTEEIKETQDKLKEKALVLESRDDNTLLAFIEALAEYEKLETKNGFFLMNEDGYCDSAGHNNEFGHSVGAVTRLDKIARYAISYLFKHPDTVLIMTADHETGGIKYNEEKGEWEFTTTSHTGVNVPVYAMGYGTETFNGTTVDNTDISRFIAHIMGESNWGDPRITPKITLPDLD